MIKENSKLSLIYLSVWIVLSLTLTILNKVTLQTIGFNFPTIFTFFHLSFSTVISWIVACFNKPEEFKDEIETAKREKGIMLRILELSIVFTTNVIFGNISLSLCSVSYVQIVRSIIPFITMVLTCIIFKTQVTIHQIISCAIVCAGVMLTCYGEINLTLWGSIAVLIGCLLSSFKTVFLKYLLNGDYAIKSADLWVRMSPISSIETFIIAYFTKEPDQLLKSEKSFLTFRTLGIIFLCSFLAYFMNMANILATNYSNPLTIKIAGCVKQILTIIVSIIVFKKKITFINASGMAITIVGSIYYSLIKPCQDRKDEQQNEKTTIKIEDDEMKDLGDKSKDYENIKAETQKGCDEELMVEEKKEETT